MRKRISKQHVKARGGFVASNLIALCSVISQVCHMICILLLIHLKSLLKCTGAGGREDYIESLTESRYNVCADWETVQPEMVRRLVCKSLWLCIISDGVPILGILPF